MAVNGLKNDLYLDWIDSDISISKELAALYSNFVIGTPGYDISKKGRDLFNHYHFIEITDYSRLYDDLMGNIDVKAFDTYEALKNAILSDQVMSFKKEVPLIDKEHIYFYSSSYEKTSFYKECFQGVDTSRKGKKKQQQNIEAISRKHLAELDGLFRHLRNCFAHGMYKIVKQKNKKYIVLQDENNDGFISARMIIQISTLTKWINYFDQREQFVNSQLSRNGES